MEGSKFGASTVGGIVKLPNTDICIDNFSIQPMRPSHVGNGLSESAGGLGDPGPTGLSPLGPLTPSSPSSQGEDAFELDQKHQVDT